MTITSIPLCYAPLATVFIDDDTDFLDSIEYSLPKNQARLCYDKPIEAISLIKNNQFNYFSICDLNDADQTKSININKLYENIYNADRLKNIGIAIIDYAMPGMNGLDICDNLKSLPVKKILLTGEADEKLAVRAFNNGFIDFFILKSEKNLMQTINEAIQKMQQEYFCGISSENHNLLTNTTLKLLSDPTYIGIFTKLFKENSVIEYYILDHSGSYLLLDSDRNPIWFIVKSEAEMQEYSEFLSLYDVSTSIALEIRQRKKIPFFFSAEDFKIPPSQWVNYLHPAFAFLNGYYYSIIKGNKLYKLKTTKG